MIDTLVKNLKKTEIVKMQFETLFLKRIKMGEDFVPREYGVMTFHRPANVDQKENL
jgi:UDP-N-acetylglucosamine 2-epimerase (non-hydrolysing)